MKTYSQDMLKELLLSQPMTAADVSVIFQCGAPTANRRLRSIKGVRSKLNPDARTSSTGPVPRVYWLSI